MTKIAMRFVTTTDIPIGDALVAIRLTRSDYEEKTSGVLMPRLEEFHTDADGFLQVDLMPATHLYHVTVYDTVQDIAIHHDFIVPEVEDPNAVLLLPDLIVPPDTVLSSLPYDEEALAKIIQAKIESVAAALQSQASAATAASSAATAVAAIDTVKADADKVEAWTATVDQQHTEVGAWTIQVAQNKTAVDAAVIVVNQGKVAAVNAAAGAKTSETNAANHAATASTDSQSATASKTAAAASASAASGSQTAAANSAAAALASQTSATQSATTATTAASTATTAKNDALTYKDQAFQYMTNAQTAKGSAEGSAAAALASANSATNSATSATGAASTATGASTIATTARDQAVDARNTAVAARDTASQKAIDAAASAAAAQAAMVNKLDKSAASVAPAVDSVPLANANGYMNPAWIDPTLPIQTGGRLCSGPTAKYGYSYLTNGAEFARWIHIATIPSENVGGHENLIIRGVFNANWAASTSAPFTIFMGVRAGFYVDWHIEGPILLQSRIVVIKRADGVYTVYACFPATVFASISFDLIGMDTDTYATPVETYSTPIGTVVFDSGTSPGDTGYIATRWRTPFNSGGKGLQVSEMLAVGDGSITTSYISAGALQNELAPGAEKDVLNLGVGGIDSLAHPGAFRFLASAGVGSLQKEGYRLGLRAYDVGSNVWSADLLSIKGGGDVYMSRLKAGSSDPSAFHNISRGTGQGAEILMIGVDNAPAPSVGILASDGAGGWGPTPSVLYVGKNSVTGRAVTTPGTVNTMGNDYAEYIFKCSACGIVYPGQIVGITADNKVTDKWADAVMFSIKSTAPSFVGGDTWANHLGQRPSPSAGQAPVKPAIREDVVTQQAVPGTNPLEFEDVVTEPGDTNEEWEAKMTTYTVSVAEWEQAVEADRVAMEEFDAKLEEARARVDRIAIAGRVPVNVIGAQPGDYIVPVQDGEGIKGIAVKEDDMTLRLYLRAVGQVITIEEDGRAYVMVKSV